MSLLRKVRAEIAGALRSVRYDLGRRPVTPDAGGPDVTSTGMCTFGIPDEAPPRRRSGRTLVVAALGALALAGSGTVYLVGVVSGSAPEPAAAGTVPPPVVSAEEGLGRGPVAAGKKAPATTAVAVPGQPVEPAATPGQTTVAATPRPVRTTKPTNPECRCESPPVPTPTAPTSSPSATPSESASTAEPTPSESSPSPSESVSPSETSDSPEPRHRRRHH